MKKNQDEKKTRHFGSAFLALVFAAVFCFAAYNLGGELLGARREKAAFDDLAAIVSRNAAQSAQSAAPVAREERNENAEASTDALIQGEAVSKASEAQTVPTAAIPMDKGLRADSVENTLYEAAEAAPASTAPAQDSQAFDVPMTDILAADAAVGTGPESGGKTGNLMANKEYESGVTEPVEGTERRTEPVDALEDDANIDRGETVKNTSSLSATEMPAATPTPEPPEPLPEYAPIYEMNPDFYGWLVIDDTNINYPVMYAPDKHEYYLKHAFDGSPSASGVPFIDDACQPEVGFCIIHGHHMKDKTMFGQLPLYAEEKFWKEHPVVRFDSRFEHREYAVVAAFLSCIYPSYKTDVFRYYAFTDLSDPLVFEEYAEQVKKAALYDTGVELEYGDDVLVLSTCNYHTTDGRFVVVAKRLDDGELQLSVNDKGD